MVTYSRVALAVIVFGLSVGQIAVRAQSLDLMQLKQNLDLPFNGGLVDRDRIHFYGSEYELNGIFYVIDRSASMMDSGELAIAKREVVKNIMELSHETEIGIVFFDRGIVKFPASGRPVKMTSAIKASATNFVQSIPGGGGSCVKEGLIEGLLYANLSSADRKVLLYVGDGGGTCNGSNKQEYLSSTLSVVRSQNFQMAQINTIGVLQINNLRDEFLRALSNSNYGTYRKITR